MDDFFSILVLFSQMFYTSVLIFKSKKIAKEKKMRMKILSYYFKESEENNFSKDYSHFLPHCSLPSPACRL